MAKAIKMKENEEALHDHFYFLIENTQSTLFTDFGLEHFHHEKNPENFKAVLNVQKQLVNYLKSFSFVLMEFKDLRASEINFVTKIFNLCIKFQLPFYPPYKPQLCQNLILLINSLPTMTYNNFIFKTFWQDLLEKVIEHSSFEEHDHYLIYIDFISKVTNY